MSQWSLWMKNTSNTLIKIISTSKPGECGAMFTVWAFMWQLYGVWQYFAGNVAHIIRGGACGALRRKKLKAPLSNQAS
jgi:hypothetical protein